MARSIRHHPHAGPGDWLLEQEGRPSQCTLVTSTAGLREVGSQGVRCHLKFSLKKALGRNDAQTEHQR